MILVSRDSRKQMKKTVEGVGGQWGCVCVGEKAAPGTAKTLSAIFNAFAENVLSSRATWIDLIMRRGDKTRDLI